MPRITVTTQHPACHPAGEEFTAIGRESRGTVHLRSNKSPGITGQELLSRQSSSPAPAVLETGTSPPNTIPVAGENSVDMQDVIYPPLLVPGLLRS